jgi:hypothetical protein
MDLWKTLKDTVADLQNQQWSAWIASFVLSLRLNFHSADTPPGKPIKSQSYFTLLSIKINPFFT